MNEITKHLFRFGQCFLEIKYTTSQIQKTRIVRNTGKIADRKVLKNTFEGNGSLIS